MGSDLYKQSGIEKITGLIKYEKIIVILSNNKKCINITQILFFPIIFTKIKSVLIFKAGKGEGNGHLILCWWEER